MTTSAYMPDVRVEIAFNAGYTTAAVDRVWTDVSDYVELDRGIGITYGRQDELSEPDANEATLVLDNSDGRFTAGLASSPYYPNVKVGRPLRVVATPVGGVESVRFTGYVEEWPVEWDESEDVAYASVRAVSRMSRLGLSDELPNIISAQILSLDPVAYYTLGEPQGSTQAADSSRNDAPPLAIATGNGVGDPVTFGQATGPGTDGLTAATFAGGDGLVSSSPAWSQSDPLTVSMYVLRDGNQDGTTVSTDPRALWVTSDAPASVDTFAIMIARTGEIMVGQHSGKDFTPVATSTLQVDDGSVHHIAVTSDPMAGVNIYIDGEHNVSGGGVTWDQFSNGPNVGHTISPDVAAGDFFEMETNWYGGHIGVMAHVAWFASALSSTEIAAIATAGLTGFAGDTPGARIGRYADYAQIADAEQSLDTGTAPISHIDTTGQSAVALMQLVAATESGVLHDDRHGDLAFHDRASRYAAATSFTLDMGAHQVERGFAPKVDRSALLNDVTTASQDGSASTRAVDETSRNEYGVHSASLELATDDADELHGAAWWRVNTYAEPSPRVPSLGVDLLPLPAATQDLLLAADISTRFAVTGLPAQASVSTGDYFVEGYTETIGTEFYVLTFNVTDATPWLTWILDDPARSQLDSTTKVAY